jgi:hypothetical protein
MFHLLAAEIGEGKAIRIAHAMGWKIEESER